MRLLFFHPAFLKGGIRVQIEEIHVYGFGQLRDVTYRFGEGLNIVEGLNEAGKTTLMAFIRGVLFGFESRRNPELRYEPDEGGRFGGVLVLKDAAGQRYRVERIFRKKVAGDVIVQLPDGGEAGEVFLHQLLGQMNEKVFKNIFAFGLTELQQIEALREDEINHFIYTAGTGDGNAIRKAQKELEEKALSLFRPYGSKSKINRKLQQIRDVNRQLTRLKEENQQYELLVAELEALDRQLEQDERDAETLRKQITTEEKIRDHYADYVRYMSLEDRLAALPEIDRFPEDGVVRLDALQEQIRERRAELKKLNDQHNRLRTRLQSPADHESILRYQMEIEDLRDKLSRYRGHKEEFERSKLNIQREKERFEELIDRLGSPWNEERVTQFDTSHAVRRVVRDFQTSLDELRKQMSLVAHERDSARQDMEQSEAEWREWKEREVKHPTKTNAMLERERRALVRAKQLEQQHTALQHRITAVKEKMKDYEEAQDASSRAENEAEDAPFWKWGLLGITFVLPVGLWLVGQPLVAALAFFIFGVLTIREFWPKKDKPSPEDAWAGSFARKKEAAEKELTTLQKEADEWQSQLEGICHEFAREGTDLFDWEQRWEEERDQLRRWERWNEQREQKERALTQARAAYERAEQKWDKLRKNDLEERERWRQWLEAHELLGDQAQLHPPDLVLEMMQDIELAKEAVKRIKEWSAQLHQNEALITEYEQQRQTVIAHTKAAITATDAEFQVRELSQLLEAAKEEANRRQRWQEQLTEIESQRAAVESRLHVLQEERSQLLQQGGAADEETFRLRAEQYQKRLELKQELDLLARSLTRLSQELYHTREHLPFNENGSKKRDHDEGLERLFQQLAQTSETEIEERLHTLREEWEAHRHRLKEKQNERATLKVKIEQLASGTELSEQNQHYHQLVADLNEEAREWAVTTLAQHLLQRAIHVYEQEKQPGVLKRASHYLHVLTDGRYGRVMAPIGEQSIEVERYDGKRLEPVILSRGTVEQLYLAVRFALAEEYVQQAKLPLVLDDIFVNFDPLRTRAAVRTLQTIAEERQVFFLTCHPHICALFEQEGATHERITLDIPHKSPMSLNA